MFQKVVRATIYCRMKISSINIQKKFIRQCIDEIHRRFGNDERSLRDEDPCQCRRIEIRNQRFFFFVALNKLFIIKKKKREDTSMHISSLLILKREISV